MYPDIRISVVMAVKNAARYLRGALDSITAQTFAPTEVILVDGASTDDTAAIALAHPLVRLIQETGRGYASAWNDGIRASVGTHIAFLDSDDRWVPDKLQWQVDALRADPAARWAIGHVQFFAEPGRPLPPSFKPHLLERPHVAYMPGAMLVERSVFDDVGFFDPSWTIANDIDWFAKLKDKRVPVTILPHVLIHKRVHDTNVSYTAASSPQVNQEILHLLRQSIRRQRGGGGAAAADPSPE